MSVCVYICIHMCVKVCYYICMCTCLCICVLVYMCAYMHICACICIPMCLYVGVCVYVYSWMYVCVWCVLFICVYMSLYVCVCMWRSVFECTYVCVFAFVFACDIESLLRSEEKHQKLFFSLSVHCIKIAMHAWYQVSLSNKLSPQHISSHICVNIQLNKNFSEWAHWLLEVLCAISRLIQQCEHQNEMKHIKLLISYAYKVCWLNNCSYTISLPNILSYLHNNSCCK